MVNKDEKTKSYCAIFSFDNMLIIAQKFWKKCKYEEVTKNRLAKVSLVLRNNIREVFYKNAVMQNMCTALLLLYSCEWKC